MEPEEKKQNKQRKPRQSYSPRAEIEALKDKLLNMEAQRNDVIREFTEHLQDAHAAEVRRLEGLRVIARNLKEDEVVLISKDTLEFMLNFIAVRNVTKWSVVTNETPADNQKGAQ